MELSEKIQQAVLKGDDSNSIKRVAQEDEKVKLLSIVDYGRKKSLQVILL